MTEPSSGTPSPLPAESNEPQGPDPAIAPDEDLEADLDADEGTEEADSDEYELEEEGEDEEFEEGETEPGEPAAPEAAVPGAIARPGSTTVRRRGASAPVAQRAPTQSELAVRVTDNQSRYFVIATVVVFAAILAFGVFGGSGGLLTPRATPTVAPSVSAAPSASVVPSASPAPSTSPAASASPAASPSAAASASPS